ncbi:unnamed protein product [Ranitomeya imitator]|uniref:Uncharacterized protein n=1 Tax=Ranitomeya imitator TaxID=111125 RepID=A0ABN9LZE4_9NEOB|nr:unnamed protein product [Ranitomeya imitator]
MNSGLPPTPSAVVSPPGAPQLPPMGGPGVKLKFCRYYAKDKTCFYGDECQFLHEEPLGIHGNSLAGYPLPGPVTPVGKKVELGGLDGPRLTIPGIDGVLPDSSLTDSYFSTSFIGMNGFETSSRSHEVFRQNGPISFNVKAPQRQITLGCSKGTVTHSDAAAIPTTIRIAAASLFGRWRAVTQTALQRPTMPRMTNSSSSPSLLNDSAKQYAGHDPLVSPASSIFNDFGGLSISQRRKTPNPTASEFIPKGGSTSRLSNMSQSNISAFSQALFSHPSMAGPAAAGLAPGMSLSAGSSPLHSPKITPHTSPSPRRRSHTPNPATYMVPTSASTPVTNSVSQPPSAGQVIQKETVGGTTYFYTDTTPAPPAGMVFPNYHLYPPTAPHVAYMQPKANAPSFFMADELRQELINRHLITMAQIDQADMPAVPAEVDSYHSLFPLEPLPPPNRIHKSSNFGYITSCYKAVNGKDDLTYCLKRVHGFRLVNTKCMSLVDTWKKVQHSNIVSLREMFTTKAFGEHSLVFAYDFHAGAETMMSRHFNEPSSDGYFSKRKWGQHDGPLPRQHAGLLPESLIWAYIVQLSSALRTIHTAGLACRVMDPTKILITGKTKTRLHVNCVGIFDVLTYDGSQSNPVALMPQYQQADLISLGKVVLALSCNSLAGIQRENLQKAMELVNINYSSDLKNLIL